MLRGKKREKRDAGILTGNSRVRAKARAMIYMPTETDVVPKESFDNAIKRCKALRHDSTSTWYQADVLYHVEVRQRPRMHQLAHDTSNSSDRYLALIRKKNPLTQVSTTIYIVQITVRGTGEDMDVQIRHAFELASLKAIDSIDDRTTEEGENENELVFVFPQLDVALFFDTERAKSECTWVLVKVARSVYSVDISYDYKLDLESVGYAFVTSGKLQNFPLLHKVGIGSTVGDMFAEEEMEADQVMTELHWAGQHDFSFLSTEELLQALEKQNTSLQDEIIDFLLKWEEDDGAGSAGMSRMSLAPLTFSEGTGVSRLAGDTVDVLDALNSVDEDLEGVDGWLGDQIDQLNFIQSKLFKIESESGNLETGYSNLSSVQKIVDEVILTLQLSDADEKCLRSCMTLVQQVLGAPDLTDADVKLAPLVTSLSNIQKALKMKGNEMPNGEGMSATIWSALQTISAIAIQRGKLLELSDACHLMLANGSMNIFEGVLKHKSLSKKSKTTVVVTYQLSGILDVIVPKLNNFKNYALGEDIQKNQALTAQRTYHSALSDFLPLLELILEYSKFQPIGGVQHDSQNYSNDMQPWNKLILANYVAAGESLFYGPLIKSLFAELNSLMGSRRSPLTMKTVKSFYPSKAKGASTAITDQIAEKDKEILYFRTPRTSVNSQSPALTPWEALEVAIVVLAPVITREEGFFQSIFHCEDKGLGYDRTAKGEVVVFRNETDAAVNADANSNQAGSAVLPGTRANPSLAPELDSKVAQLPALETYLNDMLQDAPICFNKLIHNIDHSLFGGHSSDTDGMDAIAMLAVIQNFMIRNKIPHDPPRWNEQLAAAAMAGGGEGRGSKHEYSMYLASMLYRIRTSLMGSVKLYLDQNVAWLEQQVADPKQAAVFAPVNRFPSLLVCILSITSRLLDGTVLPCVDELIFVLTRELLKWIIKIAKINPKYQDVVLMRNMAYFEEIIGTIIKEYQNTGNGTGVSATVSLLQSFVIYAGEQRRAAEKSYIRWMLSYELPELASIASRMEGLGERVKMEELALYVRRKDVLSVVNGLDSRTLETAISHMKTRTRKHLGADATEDIFYNGRTLCERTWEALALSMENMLTKLAESALASYQISLLVQPDAVKAMFGKM